VRGLIGRPDTAQGTPQRILFYVNGRPVQDRLLLSALRQAYKGRLLSREYPQAVLFFTVPGRDVDVNVHPAKSEVRFRNEGAIYSLVAEAVEKGLEDEATSAGAEGKETSPGGSPADREPRYKFRGLEELQREAVRETPPEPDYRAESTGSAGTAPPSSGTLHGPRVAASREEPGVTLGPGRLFLGQVASAYLLVDDSDRGLLIVDQHAAHERVLFHGFRQQGPGQTQLLAPPREIALHPSEKGALQKCADLLRRLGFAFDWDGGDTVTLRGVPAHLEPSRGAELLRDVLGERTDTMDGLWTVLACKKAVKAGEDLSRDEAAHLLEQWLQTPDRDYCPHGRPVAVRLQESDLERMFKRRR
jgi:DNA mismatch repair protein MutL